MVVMIETAATTVTQPAIRSMTRVLGARKVSKKSRMTEAGLEAAARSFLHHQVRSMVGCLALVGMGHWPVERMAEALAARDRQALGHNAPPEGLYFMSADY